MVLQSQLLIGSIRVQRLAPFERIFRCQKCGTVIDRDYNASLNLLSLITQKRVGTDYPELTPADLAALLFLFAKNGIITSKVETGMQHEL